MRDCIKALKKDNIDFYLKLLTELGLLRARNECAMCFKLINIKDYHIQLCKNCRLKQMTKLTEEIKSNEEKKE